MDLDLQICESSSRGIRDKKNHTLVAIYLFKVVYYEYMTIEKNQSSSKRGNMTPIWGLSSSKFFQQLR